LLFLFPILVLNTRLIQAKSLSQILQISSTILYTDNFDRPDNDFLNNGWVEVEETGAQVGIQGDRLCFLDTSDVVNRPIALVTFQQVSSGELTWNFDFDWARIKKEGTYRLFMQLGKSVLMDNNNQSNGVGVNLVWTQLNNIHQTLGYQQQGVDTALLVMSGPTSVSVLVNLDNKTYDVSVNGSIVQTGIVFDNDVDIDTVRFFTDVLNDFYFSGRCFDNLVLTGDAISATEPTILSNPATEINLWQPYSYDVNASGEPAPIYTLINSPLGMNIDSTSGVITWTPGKTGLLPVTVQAINSAGVDTQSFDINVSGIPQIPCSSPVKVMPLGDSITVGKSSGVDDLSKQISYRKDLWDDLIATGYSVDFVGSVTNGDFYAGFDPHHEGHGGWTDIQIASNIYDNGGENWLNQNPADVILLHIGTNALNPDPSDVDDILNEIDQFELDQGKQVIVLLARIINQVPYNPVVSQFNDNIMAVAQGRIDSGDKIILVDMENEAGIVYNIQPSGDMWDSLHPYASGYKKMGIEWYSSLIEILPSCPGGGSGDEIIGIGVMGDSNSDEYHANDNRGGEYADTTFTWVEILAQARDLNFGAWGSWDEPRRDGFEYNWARSNATTGSMITSGQHTGIAQQVASGKVSHVFIWIGANDFNIVSGQYQQIYDNSLSDAALQTKVDKIITDMTTAMDTVYQAGDVKIVIATFSDPGISPLTKIDFTDANKRQRVTNAIQDVNEGIKIAAAERGISVVDVDEYGLQVLAKMDEDGYFEFGGEMINVLEQGNEPHHLQLGDSAGHPGTIASGMFANELFIKPINSTYGTQIISLSEIEILEIAGISQNGISGSEPTILSNPATESNLWQPYSYDVNASVGSQLRFTR